MKQIYFTIRSMDEVPEAAKEIQRIIQSRHRPNSVYKPFDLRELLALTPELKEMILQKHSNAEMKATAQKNMMTMHQDALQKAAAGITSLEEILRVSSGDLQE